MQVSKSAVPSRRPGSPRSKRRLSPSRHAARAKRPDAYLELAKTLYQRSLKEHSNASWHDQTLRELALLIESMAADQFPPLAEPSFSLDGGKPDPKAPPRQAGGRSDRRPAAAAGQIAGRRAAQALPAWVDLVKRYPKSPRMPQALYHAGVLFAEANRPDEALIAFSMLAQKYPGSQWTPDAEVRLIDVKLEQQFDLPGAAALAAAAVAWAEAHPARGLSPFAESAEQKGTVPLAHRPSRQLPPPPTPPLRRRPSRPTIFSHRCAKCNTTSTSAPA